MTDFIYLIGIPIVFIIHVTYNWIEANKCSNKEERIAYFKDHILLCFLWSLLSWFSLLIILFLWLLVVYIYPFSVKVWNYIMNKIFK